MRFEPIALAVVLFAAEPAVCAVMPHPGAGDPHIQSVDYNAQQVVILRVALNYALTVEFSPDERVENVSVGNSGAWQVAVNKSANRLFIKPIEMSPDTDLTVVTDTRLYSFQLSAAPSPDGSTPYVLSFTYPRAAGDQPAPAPAVQASVYHFDGARGLRPLAMSDDGRATTITWPEQVPFPEVSIIDRDGKEALVNGVVRDGRYVVDEVADRFIFRDDGRVATATRHVVKGHPR